MNSILKEIVLYPAPLFYGLLGVMGGAVGAGLAAIVSRIWPAAKEFSRALTIAFVFLATQLPRIISGERKIEIDHNADHSELLLANITDRLIAEVLV